MDLLNNQFNKMLDKKGIEITNLSDNSTFKGFLKELNDTNETDYKYLYISEEIDISTTLLVLGHIYIVINKQGDFNGVYNRYIIRKTNYTINIYIDDTLNNIPACVDAKTGGLTTYSNVITIPEGKILITINDTDTNRQIAYGSRFILFKQAWIVTDYNWLNGLIHLTLEEDAIRPDDDLENEIAENDGTPIDDGNDNDDGNDDGNGNDTSNAEFRLKEDNYNIYYGFTLDFEAILYVDGEPVDPQPEVKYTFDRPDWVETRQEGNVIYISAYKIPGDSGYLETKDITMTVTGGGVTTVFDMKIKNL